jgi:threonine/homoserine/homoserine lactone efflux protein
VGGAVNLVLVAIGKVVNMLFKLFSTAAALFAVWIAYKLMRAEDEGKRKEAKKQLLWTFIAIMGTVMISILLNYLFTIEMKIL